MAYFFDAKKRAAVRKRLGDLLPGPDAPVTLVAHSQGSIVAVEVLALVPKIHVGKMVTIGSPLGLQEVQDFLDVQPRRKPFNKPTCIERWDNFPDPVDPVASIRRWRPSSRSHRDLATCRPGHAHQ